MYAWLTMGVSPNNSTMGVWVSPDNILERYHGVGAVLHFQLGVKELFQLL